MRYRGNFLDLKLDKMKIHVFLKTQQNCMNNFLQSYCPMFQKLKGVRFDERVKYKVIRTYVHFPFFVPLQNTKTSADTKFTSDPIKIDIFVEKSKVQIQKQACIIWIKDIKKPSISVHLPVHLKNQYMYL